MKHTPGKWEYGVRSDGSIWLSIGDPAAGPHYQGDLVAAEADARLIVSAPDLLEALQLMLRQFTKIPSSLKDSEARNIAHAAIAKATGSKA